MTNPTPRPPGAPRRPSRAFVMIALGLVAVGGVLVATGRIAAERRPDRTPPAPRPEPGWGLSFARTQIRLDVPALVFHGDRFPAITLERPSHLEDRLGPAVLMARFFDRDGREVESPTEPGPYAAVVRVAPPGGERPSFRYMTLGRTAEPLPPDERFDPDRPEALASALGVPRSVVEREARLLDARLKGRPYGEASRDPSVARVLAGLMLEGVQDGPARRWSDAEAAERRWWVALRRTLEDPDGTPPRALDGPRPLDGPLAPVLRGGTLAEAGMKPGAVEAIDAVLRSWSLDTDQAFAVCVARKGVIVLHRAYGVRDGRPMTVSTPSWMASVTKTLNATLLMMLVDEGRITLDDRADDLLPALRGLPTARPITVRHLYTHTHGLDAWLRKADDQPDFARRVADCYPSARAGRVWNYNGVGYILGGQILEDLTGECLADLYRENLLGPLELDATDVAGSHGDMRSIPLDMARFGQMLLNGGAYGKTRFLRRETWRKMLPERLTKTLGPEAKKSWGIGLDGTDRAFFHGAASLATFQVDLDRDLVIVMTRDLQGRNFHETHPKFIQAIHDGIAP